MSMSASSEEPKASLSRTLEYYEGIPVVRWLVLQRVYRNRKQAASAISDGLISINGGLCASLAQLVQEVDSVECNGEVVKKRRIEHTHYILHKPNGCISSRKNVVQLKGGGKAVDERPSVYDYLPKEDRYHVNSIGRLDFDTSGLLIFTSDGKLHNTLASPDYKVKKIYRCTLRSPDVLSENAIQQLDEGVQLPHAKAAIVKGKACNVVDCPGVVDLSITGGYKHQVKLMMSLVKRPLRLLHRRTFANLELPPDLQEGQCRPLNQSELEHLYSLAKERLELQRSATIGTADLATVQK